MLHLWKAFVKAGAKYTIEIDEINVAYINIGILELLIYNNQEEALKYILQARNCYIEESSIQGLVNSLLYLVIYYIVVGKSQKNFKIMEQAEHLFEETNTIIAHEKLTEQKAYLRNIVLRLLTTI